MPAASSSLPSLGPTLGPALGGALLKTENGPLFEPESPEMATTDTTQRTPVYNPVSETSFIAPLGLEAMNAQLYDILRCSRYGTQVAILPGCSIDYNNEYLRSPRSANPVTLANMGPLLDVAMLEATHGPLYDPKISAKLIATRKGGRKTSRSNRSVFALQ